MQAVNRLIHLFNDNNLQALTKRKIAYHLHLDRDRLGFIDYLAGDGQLLIPKDDGKHYELHPDVLKKFLLTTESGVTINIYKGDFTGDLSLISPDEIRKTIIEAAQERHLMIDKIIIYSDNTFTVLYRPFRYNKALGKAVIDGQMQLHPQKWYELAEETTDPFLRGYYQQIAKIPPSNLPRLADLLPIIETEFGAIGSVFKLSTNDFNVYEHIDPALDDPLAIEHFADAPLGIRYDVISGSLVFLNAAGDADYYEQSFEIVAAKYPALKRV